MILSGRRYIVAANQTKHKKPISILRFLWLDRRAYLAVLCDHTFVGQWDISRRYSKFPCRRVKYSGFKMDIWKKTWLTAINFNESRHYALSGLNDCAKNLFIHLKKNEVEILVKITFYLYIEFLLNYVKRLGDFV